MQRFILLLIFTFAAAFAANSKSPEKQIKDAMEASDWLALDSIYKTVPKNSISEFLDLFSRFLIGNRLNRPEISIPAFEQLYTNHSKKLSNITPYAILCAIDLGRIGENAKAASLLTEVMNSEKGHSDAKTLLKLNRAGVGGTIVTEGFLLPDVSLSLGGNSVTVPQIEVLPDQNPFNYECNLGLKSLMLFKKAHFNLVDFVLSTEE